MGVRVAVQGCSHGELNSIFEKVNEMHRENPIDMLLILGDFQSIRSVEDFESVSIPAKYQKLGDFHKFYNYQEGDEGVVLPLMMTFVIGGNHESMKHLMSLPFGGYMAKNIFYLGYSNVVWYKGLRIGALSGIFKKWDFKKGRPSLETLKNKNLWERYKKNLYHVRESDVTPLFMLSGESRVDIMMTHDWPSEIVYHGDYTGLMRVKPYFKDDINKRELGSSISSYLLQKLKPKWWVSAHLHVRYRATMQHTQRKRKLENAEEIELFEEDEPQQSELTTDFLALDKCLPRRRHLEIIELQNDTTHPSTTDNKIYYDPEFIQNLRYSLENTQQLRETPFAETNWLMQQKAANPDTVAAKIDWSDYCIESYQDKIQQKEKQQTATFETKFNMPLMYQS